jgi:2-polyprenyl-6-methoxyphenol hydroxylase-like FAD-dependent oxidoreductase
MAGDPTGYFMITTDVLIVGGGPVGLALALELGRRGVACVVAEQNQQPARQPRAKTTNVRSMEHMRRWGLAETLRAAAPLPADYPTDVCFATRLYGPRLGWIRNAFHGYRQRCDEVAEPAQWIPQYKVEAVLRAAASQQADIRSGLRLASLTQDSDSVLAELTDLADGTSLQVQARYLVGADGARSTVRGAIGARMSGQHAYATNFNVVARVRGMAPLLAADPALMYWLVNPESPGFAGPMDVDDTWFFGFVARDGETTLDDAAARARIDAACGRAMDAEILVTDIWGAHALIAGHYRQGRVFLAGDACHLHPPFGGYGMNLGIADAVDLGWKLAARLQGWGGEALLESYQAERKPIHQQVIDEAVANYAQVPHFMVRDGLEDDSAAGEATRAALGAWIEQAKPREFHTLGLVKGYRYTGSPVLVDDGSPVLPLDVGHYRPSAAPGSVAPHAWLGDVSLYDRFGSGFSLLVMRDGLEAERDALVASAAALCMPLTVVATDLAALYGAGLALIRPDQHVAWRGDKLDQPAADLLRLVCGLDSAIGQSVMTEDGIAKGSESRG